MSSRENWDRALVLEMVHRCVTRELRSGALLPGEELDLVKTEAVDSMGWVGILSGIEEAAGIRNFGNSWPEDRPQSIRSLVEVICASPGPEREKAAKENPRTAGGSSAVSLPGWGAALGSIVLEIEQVERECGLAPATLRERAGIQSVRRADLNENEVILGQRAAELALGVARLDIDDVDLLVATTTTFLSLPSFAAALHARLLLRDSCAALDVGGACVGVVHALATAGALLSTSKRRVALVVSSEVNSRRLSSPQVPGEFRGLFGDGACAFVLARSDSGQTEAALRLGEFISGCSGTFTSALRLELRDDNRLNVHFKGEELAQAALGQLERVLDGLENLSGKSRAAVDYFALHEPNPRLVEILSLQAGISLEKIARISRTCGNLGSATCGVSLCSALTKAAAIGDTARRPLIFVAAVGPGLLSAGTYLD